MTITGPQYYHLPRSLSPTTENPFAVPLLWGAPTQSTTHVLDDALVTGRTRRRRRIPCHSYDSAKRSFNHSCYYYEEQVMMQNAVRWSVHDPFRNHTTHSLVAFVNSCGCCYYYCHHPTTHNPRPKPPQNLCTVPALHRVSAFISSYSFVFLLCEYSDCCCCCSCPWCTHSFIASSHSSHIPLKSFSAFLITLRPV